MPEIGVDGPAAETAECLRRHLAGPEQRAAPAQARVDVEPVVVGPHEAEFELVDVRGSQEAVIQAVFEKRAVIVVIIVEDEVIDAVRGGVFDLLRHNGGVRFVGVAEDGHFGLAVARETRRHRLDQLPFAPAFAVDGRVARFAAVIVRKIVTADIGTLRIHQCSTPYWLRFAELT